MSNENKKVILMTFNESSKSYEAFSDVKQIVGNGDIRGEEMAVVTHKTEGVQTFEVDDFINFKGDTHVFNDGFIGMLIGILGGFFGMIIGWIVGDIVGAVRDSDDAKATRNLFEQMVQDIPAGQTGVILVAEEADNQFLNNVVINQLGGKIDRFSYEEVSADMEHAKNIVEETKKDVKDKWNKKQDAK